MSSDIPAAAHPALIFLAQEGLAYPACMVLLVIVVAFLLAACSALICACSARPRRGVLLGGLSMVISGCGIAAYVYFNAYTAQDIPELLRDIPHNPLLMGLSVMGILTFLTVTVVWLVRRPRRRRAVEKADESRNG